MLTIRNSQIEVFRNQKLSQFIQQQVVNLQDKLPEEVSNITTLALKERVEEIIAFGKKEGVQTAKDFEYLIIVMVKYSVLLDSLKTDDNIREILEYPDRTPEDKIIRIHQYYEFDRTK